MIPQVGFLIRDTTVQLFEQSHINEKLTPIQHCANSIASTSIAKGLMMPFEVAQTLIQTNSEDAKDGVFATLIHLYNTYGLKSWWRGNTPACSIVVAAAVGNLVMSAPSIRDYVNSPAMRILMSSAFVAATYPLKVVQARMITHPKKYKSTMESIQNLYKDELPAFFKGMTTGILLFLITTASHEFMFKFFDSALNKPKSTMSRWEHLFVHMIAAFVAGAIEYPIETALKIIQTTQDTTDNVSQVLTNTGKISRTNEGVVGLYKGFTANLFKPFVIPLQAQVSDISQRILFKL